MSGRVEASTDRTGSRDFRRLHRDPAQLASKDTRPRVHELETTSPFPGSTLFRAKNRFGRNARRQDGWGAEERNGVSEYPSRPGPPEDPDGIRASTQLPPLL